MAKLTAKERQNLKDSDFALPKERKYPIHDKNHAQVALREIAANGTQAEQKTVRAAVYKRYPEMDPAKGDGKKKRNDGMNDLIRGAAGRGDSDKGAAKPKGRFR